MCKNKKNLKTVRYAKTITQFLEILIKINIICWYKVSDINNIKYITFKINKKIKIVTLINNQKLFFSKNEILKLMKVEKTKIIISTTNGLELIKSINDVHLGGILVAKLEL